MNLQRVKPYTELISELGCEVTDISVTGSCHYKIAVTSQGKSRFFIAPFSGSDRRGLKNFRADVKRWMKSISYVGGANDII
jgi:hypothetical protein